MKGSTWESLTISPQKSTGKWTLSTDGDRCSLALRTGWLDKAFRAPECYQQLGYDVSVKLSAPMTAEFINGLFEMGHWLNENFVIRLWAILESQMFNLDL